MAGQARLKAVGTQECPRAAGSWKAGVVRKAQPSSAAAAALGTGRNPKGQTGASPPWSAGDPKPPGREGSWLGRRAQVHVESLGRNGQRPRGCGQGQVRPGFRYPLAEDAHRCPTLNPAAEPPTPSRGVCTICAAWGQDLGPLTFLAAGKGPGGGGGAWWQSEAALTPAGRSSPRLGSDP